MVFRKCNFFERGIYLLPTSVKRRAPPAAVCAAGKKDAYMSTVCPLEVCWLVRQKLDRRADVSGLPDMLELEV